MQSSKDTSVLFSTSLLSKKCSQPCHFTFPTRFGVVFTLSALFVGVFSGSWTFSLPWWLPTTSGLSSFWYKWVDLYSKKWQITLNGLILTRSLSNFSVVCLSIIAFIEALLTLFWFPFSIFPRFIFRCARVIKALPVGWADVLCLMNSKFSP